MNNTMNEILESAKLAVAKAAVDAVAIPFKNEITKKLKEIGIEAEVEVNINAISVNLDTLSAARLKREKNNAKM